MEWHDGPGMLATLRHSLCTINSSSPVSHTLQQTLLEQAGLSGQCGPLSPHHESFSCTNHTEKVCQPMEHTYWAYPGVDLYVRAADATSDSQALAERQWPHQQ